MEDEPQENIPIKNIEKPTSILKTILMLMKSQLILLISILKTILVLIQYLIILFLMI